MKNKFLVIIIFLFQTTLKAENVQIEAKNITLDKDQTTSIFENEVVVRTEDKIIKSDYLKYNKKNRFLIFKKNIVAEDNLGNIIRTDYAEYDEKKKNFLSKGPTKIITSQNYDLEGSNIFLDNAEKFIKSDDKATIVDQEGNIINLDNFEYHAESNIFKSVGNIKIKDKKTNTYEFSQVYIDTKKREILGTDIKSYLKDSNFKINQKNKPRVFANSVNINNDKKIFTKSIFTLCDYRKNDKCPPWTIQASEMLHDNKKKTIYYDNALIKVYNVPIFYIPKLSHPDPTVDRRSGFLIPSFSDSKNLGSGVSIPYFFNVANDKNFTFISRIYENENPLYMGQFHQAFKDASLLADFGYTEGYKKTSVSKKAGQKSHFFSKFVKSFKGKNNSESNLTLSVQDVSNDKYLKLYKIKSNLIDYSETFLKNSLNFTHENENIFFNLNASVYETLKESYNDKYEYILPELTLNKNLFSNDNFGSLDLQSNLKIHNYDTNKTTNFLVNDFNWDSKEFNFDTGVRSKIFGHLRNINYEAKNVDLYKKDSTSEIHGALGLLTELNLEKNVNSSSHFLTPKFMIRYAPGNMRQENTGLRLNPISAFSLERLDNINNFETGLSGTFGFDYKIENTNRDFDFSVAQIVNEKENKKMHSKTSLDEKLSDLVGSAKLAINDKIDINYNFSLDQNYSDLNYNEIGTAMNFDKLNINFDFLQEKKHIGNQEYFKTKIQLENIENNIISFETKRNLITNSADFYNLSYEYVNDCLRAGLVYRREFYNDSELEPDNSLMFKITLTPFGNINSPSFN